jgi:ribosomal-protein-alanine N-acetyltransferase
MQVAPSRTPLGIGPETGAGPPPSTFVRRSSTTRRHSNGGAPSRALHRPWTSAPDTPAKFIDWLSAWSLRPTIPSRLPPRQRELVGVVNLSNVVLGAFRSGYLGYYAFSGHER